MSEATVPAAADRRRAGGARLTLSVCTRELRQYFQSPGTYVALAFFFVLSGALFTMILGGFAENSAQFRETGSLPEGVASLNVTEQVVGPLFQALNFLMLFLIPMLTMRLLADEKRSGSFELLVTTPLSNWNILLGKYLAAFAVGLTALAVCAIYPWVCFRFAQPEPAVVLSCYAGLFLIILAYAAFGLFASSLTESQLAAGVVAFVGLLGLHMVDQLFKRGALGRIAAEISIGKHSENFTKGVLATPDIVFFLCFTAFFLFVTAEILDARRYRA